eukprot:Tamp_14370.p1 GENE.Tamp_14370~~Tamp_14370.p1  ORF type:complete len:318 (+),score=38.11 Tamp_14370:85-954(+)
MVSVSAPRFVVAVPPEEKAMRRPSPATVAAASTSLQDLGFVVLRANEGVLDTQLVDSAREEARVDLECMLSRLRKLGFDTDKDSFSFDECVHRSTKRYHLKLERRRLPPSSPWHDVSSAAAAWATPVIEACGLKGELEVAVEGVLTSLPGAPHQRFHQDGPLGGSYNCFVPLVDASAQKSGTEFWVGSHAHPSVPQLALSGKIGVSEAETLKEIIGDPDTKIVQPPLGAGDVLIYQYPVIHRGPANPAGEARPIYNCAWADTAGSGDGYNFKQHRKLADLERRQQLFGI